MKKERKCRKYMDKRPDLKGVAETNSISMLFKI
jgi:hypothetical protein